MFHGTQQKEGVSDSDLFSIESPTIARAVATMTRSRSVRFVVNIGLSTGAEKFACRLALCEFGHACYY